jgi:hypothetical protein
MADPKTPESAPGAAPSTANAHTRKAGDARPDDRSTEYENLRPDSDGEPPRPATEPRGSEGSSNSGETATDPATGEQNG